MEKQSKNNKDVFCFKCKYYDMDSLLMDNRRCMHPDLIKKEKTPECVHIIKANQAYWNKYNNCRYYKKSLFYIIIKPLVFILLTLLVLCIFGIIP